nr:MAG: aldehyde-activating protein [Pseudomonadota bacterium]
MKKTFRGSCHCRRVTFEADIDLSQGTSKCNCTFCWKKRWWSTKVAPESFRALSGTEELTRYPNASASGPGGFCKHCGVTPYLWVDAADWNDGAYVAVNVSCLDDLEPGELLEAKIQYYDGRADNWWNTPAETRHL